MEKVKEVENEDKVALTSVLFIMHWSFTDLGVIHTESTFAVKKWQWSTKNARS